MTKQVSQLTTELNAMAMVAASEPLMELVKAITQQTQTIDKKETTVVMKVDGRQLASVNIGNINEYGGGNVVVKKATPAGTRG